MTQPQLTGPVKKPSLASVAGQTLFSLALIGSAIAAVALLGKSPSPPQEIPQDTSPAVAVEIISAYDEGLTFSVDGVVRPYRDLEIAAESGGQVIEKSVSCRVGRTVSAGEVLISVDPRDYEFEVLRLEEELKQAEVSAEELVVQTQNAEKQITLADEALALNRRELGRVEAVRLPGAVTESELDTTRRDVVNSRISLQLQSDQLRLLQASLPRLQSVAERIETQLATARLALERCVIRSPIDGVITEEHVEQGGYLQRGSLVFTVRDTSRLDVRCSLRADQLELLWNSQDRKGVSSYQFPETPVTVVYEVGLRRYAWKGVLARYDGAGLDSQTRMAPCLVHVDAPRSVTLLGEKADSIGGLPSTLLVGMFVEVRIHLPSRAELLSVPAIAINPGGLVWVVQDGSLSSQSVRVANSLGDSVLVYAEPGGLAADDRVVVSPLASPADGDPVLAAPMPEDAS